MNRHLAKFLTRLYPPDWRARYGAEFQTFLESRTVPVKEIFNVVSRAAIEHVLEDLRYAPILIVFALALTGSLYLGIGHTLGDGLSHYPALSCAWLTLEAASLGLLVYSLGLGVRVILEGCGKRCGVGRKDGYRGPCSSRLPPSRRGKLCLGN